MKMSINKIIFVFIIFIGAIVRFYDLGNVPGSLSWDEVSWGYNAFSVSETLKDEYGRFLPLTFEAFGDFKQPAYVYLASIAVKLFGLDAFAVRFPSAFFGTLTIPFVYLLTKSIFFKERYGEKLALLSMLFFAISPWSIQFSRVAYEANIGLFFTISGSALLFYGMLKKHTFLLYSSLIPLILSGYSYHSQKIFTPILFTVLLAAGYFVYKIRFKTILILIIIFLISSLLWIVDPRTTQRGRSVTIFSNSLVVLKDSTENIISSQLTNDKLGIILNNRRIEYANRYIENYLYHFSPNYLFINGDNARHHAFGMGVLYIISLPLILIGLFKLDKKKYWLLLVWFFLAPVASSLAVDAPNASRSLVFLPTWQIFEALGLLYLLNLQGKKRMFGYVFSALIVVNFLYYLHQYFAHTNPQYGIYWQEGYREAVEKATELKKDRQVFFSSNFEQPYIFYLFYNKYPPQKYHAEGGSKRIKEKCFPIDNVYFGECFTKAKAGDYYILLGEEEIPYIGKIEDIANRPQLRIGVYKFL